MTALLQYIRVLAVTVCIKDVYCQDGFSDHDFLRIQQMSPNDGQIETITSYSTNIIQRDPGSQSISSVSVQYQMKDDADNDNEYNRADHGRIRKVFRIKNPFQRQVDNEKQGDSSNVSQDNDVGASNQNSAIQYSLPPEEFLQQMRAENQYYQQQQQLPTQLQSGGYTATPQPQYQYATISSSGYDNSNQQINQMSQLEPKSVSTQTYTNTNSFQYNRPNSYNSLDNIQSTSSPMSQYFSTSLPNNQLISTSASSYVSSSSPLFLSSPLNLQQYVSSPPSSPIQAASPDYNRITTTPGSNSINYENNDLNKKIQIDHYDNSANGIRHPINAQQQYQNEYSTSTPIPTTSPYSDTVRNTWKNTINANALSKTLQEVPLLQYSNSPYGNQQESKPVSNLDNASSETHRIGNYPSANNLVMSYAQPDYQVYNNMGGRTRDQEQEGSQSELFSHGDYGWKMPPKKSLSRDSYSPENYPRYQTLSPQSDTTAVSQMSFHMDYKPNNYELISKSSSENLDTQDFVKAAVKAQEIMKQKHNYVFPTNFNGNNPLASVVTGSSFSDNEKQRNKLNADSLNLNTHVYSNSQTDLITASPYYYSNFKENNLDVKAKQPFDHAKALKNIVPIDMSNVVPNSNMQLKVVGLDNNRYNFPNYGKDQFEQNLKQYYKQITDAYYKDKNTGYGFNIKTKPDDNLASDGLKQLESNMPFFGKQQSQEFPYSQSGTDNKRYQTFEGPLQSNNYMLQSTGSYQDSVQLPTNTQQSLQRPENQMISDITNIFKFSDIPHRLTQGLTADALRFHNHNFDQGSIPTPISSKFNQNVASHQIDVGNNVLNKLMLNHQYGLNINKVETEPQTNGLLSTINGFKVANPFNVDLKLVADILKGKPTVDETHTLSLRDQFSKSSPLKLDISQLQQLLSKNENYGSVASLNDGLNTFSNSHVDFYNSERYPHQGIKYSRSQEEESIVPISSSVDSSNNHPIGAVIEQDDSANERDVNTGSDLTAQGDDSVTISFSEDKPKHIFSSEHRALGDRHRHPNSLSSGRYSYQRKYPKAEVNVPYPLLQPPPLQSSKNRLNHNKTEKYSRRRRLNRPQLHRILKTEPLFESESSIEGDVESEIPILLRPPPSIAEAKSDIVNHENNS